MGLRISGLFNPRPPLLNIFSNVRLVCDVGGRRLARTQVEARPSVKIGVPCGRGQARALMGVRSWSVRRIRLGDEPRRVVAEQEPSLTLLRK